MLLQRQACVGVTSTLYYIRKYMKQKYDHKEKEYNNIMTLFHYCKYFEYEIICTDVLYIHISTT